MKKQEDARLAVLREYDRWANDHPKGDKLAMGPDCAPLWLLAARRPQREPAVSRPTTPAAA